MKTACYTLHITKPKNKRYHAISYIISTLNETEITVPGRRFYWFDIYLLNQSFSITSATTLSLHFLSVSFLFGFFMTTNRCGWRTCLQSSLKFKICFPPRSALVCLKEAGNTRKYYLAHAGMSWFAWQSKTGVPEKFSRLPGNTRKLSGTCWYEFIVLHDRVKQGYQQNSRDIAWNPT